MSSNSSHFDAPFGPIKALRTPDARFSALPDWPYAPHYVDDLAGYEGLRVHYVDEGPRDAKHTILCLHGEPTWAYLYRRMIPVFVAAGCRVIAPDWLGFGRSDKPVKDADYGFHFHREMMLRFIERLDLSSITLVVQDWGGLLGLTLPQDMPDRFARLLIMNTALAVGKTPGDGFLAWKAYAASQPDMDVGKLIARGTPHLTADEIAAYNAPYPDIRYKAGVRRFPEMVMVEPGMEGIETSKRAIAFWRDAWAGESFMAIGAQDPVLGTGTMEAIRLIIKGCPEPLVLPEAGHFVQEWGQDVARAALAAFRSD
ncbi:MAG: haloalkane dehalogenase [Pseudomonadota bacterium]